MNFLAHTIVLPEDSPALTRVGSALPDLWPLLSPRPLPALVLRGLRERGDACCAELAYGIAHHMQADAVFHSLDEFNRRVGWLSGEIRTRWPGLRQTSFYAHALVEMLLDRHLMEQDPQQLDLYYQAFQPDTLAFAAGHAINEPGQAPALHGVLERFAATQFLRTYTTAEGLSKRFLGLTRGLPWPWEWQDCRQEELACAIEPWHARLAPGSEELVEPVRRAVGRLLVR
jgi:hypothetical protein